MDFSDDFHEYMKQNLPAQVVLYLRACGFDSEKAFAAFDVSGSDSLAQVVEMLRTNSDFLKVHVPESKLMYGMFFDSPEAFCILPGHKNQILKFALDVKRVTEQNSIDREESEFLRKRKLKIQRYTKADMRSTECVSASSSPTESFLNSRVDGYLMSLDDMPKIWKKLKETITTYFKVTDEYKNIAIEHGKDYSINVYPVSSANSENCARICTSVTCHICGSKVKLPVIRLKFRPANFYRHVKSCVLNQNTRGQRKLKQSKLISSTQPENINNQPQDETANVGKQIILCNTDSSAAVESTGQNFSECYVNNFVESSKDTGGDHSVGAEICVVMSSSESEQRSNLQQNT